jgi:hypothetical protein
MPTLFLLRLHLDCRARHTQDRSYTRARKHVALNPFNCAIPFLDGGQNRVAVESEKNPRCRRYGTFAARNSYLVTVTVCRFVLLSSFSFVR